MVCPPLCEYLVNSYLMPCVYTKSKHKSSHYLLIWVFRCSVLKPTGSTCLLIESYGCNTLIPPPLQHIHTRIPPDKQKYCSNEKVMKRVSLWSNNNVEIEKFVNRSFLTLALFYCLWLHKPVVITAIMEMNYGWFWQQLACIGLLFFAFFWQYLKYLKTSYKFKSHHTHCESCSDTLWKRWKKGGKFERLSPEGFPFCPDYFKG